MKFITGQLQHFVVYNEKIDICKALRNFTNHDPPDKCIHLLFTFQINIYAKYNSKNRIKTNFILFQNQ
ncbi:hypothetical protein KFK09_017583 [Dendrobium nobile]|uniref:Uncharacterized protein n=1 Tax=Dendrobium nobile TaxID=94219 RepID=A0A8T3B3G1_DENNO|nr:hypothetical protein KFK09_017583 [Dendrobium nobile]